MTHNSDPSKIRRGATLAAGQKQNSFLADDLASDQSQAHGAAWQNLEAKVEGGTFGTFLF